VKPGDKAQLGDLEITVLEAERFRVRWVLAQSKMPEVEEIAEEEDDKRNRPSS
jgi:hypothetical protein